METIFIKFIYSLRLFEKIHIFDKGECGKNSFSLIYLILLRPFLVSKQWDELVVDLFLKELREFDSSIE